MLPIIEMDYYRNNAKLYQNNVPSDSENEISTSVLFILNRVLLNSVTKLSEKSYKVSNKILSVSVMSLQGRIQDNDTIEQCLLMKRCETERRPFSILARLSSSTMLNCR